MGQFACTVLSSISSFANGSESKKLHWRFFEAVLSAVWSVLVVILS